MAREYNLKQYDPAVRSKIAKKAKKKSPWSKQPFVVKPKNMTKKTDKKSE